MKTIEVIIQLLATGIEIISALIVVYAALTALVNYFRGFFKRNAGIVPKIQVRLALGRSLAIALELLLGADILKTAVAPSWNEIGQLAAIVAIRTALNYFLEKELEKAESPA